MQDDKGSTTTEEAPASTYTLQRAVLQVKSDIAETEFRHARAVLAVFECTNYLELDANSGSLNPDPALLTTLKDSRKALEECNEQIALFRQELQEAEEALAAANARTATLTPQMKAEPRTVVRSHGGASPTDNRAFWESQGGGIGPGGAMWGRGTNR